MMLGVWCSSGDIVLNKWVMLVSLVLIVLIIML